MVSTEKFISYEGRIIAGIRDQLEAFDDSTTKALCRDFGIAIGSSKPDNLKVKLRTTLGDRNNFSEGRFKVKVPRFPSDIRIYFLDGKSFEDVNRFIHDAFFKDRQKDLWDEPITEIGEGSTTVADYLKGKIESFKNEVEEGMSRHDLVDKLKNYIDGLNQLKIITGFERKDINLSVKVMFVVDENETEANRFGDGTRRRVTLALLQHKIEKEAGEAIYVLDEPDTHLHPKAQSSLLDIMDGITRNNNQILISTHSPFIMNSAQLRQVRILDRRDGATSIRKLGDEKDRTDSYQSLGIENSHLFFSKKIVIVEGKTEQAFFPTIYQNLYGKPLSRDFIRVIPREGIKDAARFIEVIQDFLGHSDLFIITDNDANDETQEIIDGLDIPTTNRFRLGRREFEDSFASHIIYEAWQQYVEVRHKKTIGDLWTSDAIFALLQEAGDELGRGKFSERLSELNRGCRVGMTKPKLGEALGMFCAEHHLHPDIREFLRIVRS